MLTKKQLDLLEFIHKRVQRDGVPPSFDEMKEALDLRSKSGIHRLITALEERGFIRRLAHRARALEIVKLPDAMQNSARRSGRVHGSWPLLPPFLPSFRFSFLPSFFPSFLPSCSASFLSSFFSFGPPFVPSFPARNRACSDDNSSFPPPSLSTHPPSLLLPFARR